MTREILEEQTEDKNDILPKVVLVLTSFALAVVLSVVGFRYLQTLDPYIHEVLSLHSDPSRGEAIFRMNCAVCHGLEATGEVGPALTRVSDRKTQVSLIKQVISGQTPPMPQFQPASQDMADLLGYLEKL